MSKKIIEFIQLDGHKLALYQWKITTPKYLVMLLHGYGEHLNRYEDLANQLNRNGAEVFGIDYPGHGLSSGEPVMIRDFAPLVSNLNVVVRNMQQHYPSLSLIIIAHSMGGMIATSYVQKYPNEVKALVLSGPLLGLHTQIAALADRPQLPTEPIDANTLSRDPKVVINYQNDQLVWHGPFKLATLQAIKKTLRQIHHGNTFGSLPVLWIHGSADSLVLLDETAVTMEKLAGNNLTKLIIPNGRHENFNEINRATTVAKLMSFIDQCFSNLQS